MADDTPKPVLVTGATGYVGSHLAQALVDAGREVRAMTRHPKDYDGAGTAVGADVHTVKPGDRMTFSVDIEDMQFFDPKTGLAVRG